jgi:hypothetical protein
MLLLMYFGVSKCFGEDESNDIRTTFTGIKCFLCRPKINDTGVANRELNL